MLLLQLTYDGEENFVKELQDIKLLFKERNIIIGMSESQEGTTHIVKLYCDDNDYNERIKNIIELYVSNILYKVVINFYKDSELLNYLTENYFFLKHDELLEVEKKIMNVLKCDNCIVDEDGVYCYNRTNNIISNIKSCLEESPIMNINGFITFRLKSLREDIEKIIDKVIEKYMVEKEYMEFIKLLKYFVDIQDSKIEEVNIIVQEEGNYRVEDENGYDLFKEFLEELEGNNISNVNMEDIIISGLITNCPKKIKIHNEEKCLNKEFIDTIVKVFENRVTKCSSCEKCEKKTIKIKREVDRIRTH